MAVASERRRGSGLSAHTFLDLGLGCPLRNVQLELD
jgi:hypothetical protein